MKGFIELTIRYNSQPISVQVSNIAHFSDKFICGNGWSYSVKETYEEIKQKIEEALK